jgi:putative tricarboxylic transport membrane protein
VKKYNLIGGFLWLGVSVLIGIESLRIGIGTFRAPDAGLFPLLTSILLGLFSLWLLSESLFTKSTPERNESPVWSEDTIWKNLIFTLVGLVAYALILDKAGFLLTTFAFLLFLFRAIEPQRWPTAILAALLTVFLSYAVFQMWLQSQLPEGALLNWLRRMSIG